LSLERITDQLVRELARLRFGPPVTHVYNPLDYARAPYREYLRRFGTGPRQVVLVGMNPGPWGMAQTGVPFGEVCAVRDSMGIAAAVGTPARLHPKRPVTGFACARREVSGQRLWGWAQKNFGTADVFFKHFFVANYCPLMFITESGGNLTPDKLKPPEARPLFTACDRALRRTVEYLMPEQVVGVGRFAAARAKGALDGLSAKVGGITHPSPANPQANRGWEARVAKEFRDLGIAI